MRQKRAITGVTCQHTQDGRHKTLLSHAMCQKRPVVRQKRPVVSQKRPMGGESKEEYYSHQAPTEAHIEYVSLCVCVCVCVHVCVCVWVCMCVRV